MRPATEQPQTIYDRSRTARKLTGRLKEQVGWVIFWCIILAVGIALEVLLLSMTKYFVDDVLMQPDTAKIVPYAMHVIGLVVLLIFGQGIQKGAEILATSRIGQRLIMRLRQEIYSHLQELSLDFYESQRTGTIMSWVTTDVLRIREFAGKQMPELIKGPFAVAAYLAVMFVSSWRLTLAGLVVIPLIVLVVQSGARRVRQAALNVQGSLADVSGELQEGISAIQIVKSFANEVFEIMKFGRVNLGTYKAEMRRAKIEAIMVPMLMLAGGVGLGILLLYGAWQVSVGMITAGDLVMIIAFLHKTNDESNKLGRTYMAFQDTLAASDRIFAFLEIKPTIEDRPDAVELEKCEGHVEFRDVSFRYTTGEYVLMNISITAEPGRAIALVGPSGAGKSSFAKLIPRFYDVTRGEVLVDGHDVREITMQSLRSHMGIVPQETILFHGTVRENIAYGKLDASDAEIQSAAKAANAHEFITILENGYDTLVGERGVKLSGGQRQRISIARAILKDPKILILDEATSNLDTESEKLVQAALERLMQGRTTFIIAHRLSTIRNADEILVLKAGGIVDRGTHGELMKRPGVYRELYEVEEMGEAVSS
jgi:subfamily B ATP-binding cassette protein MsbA